MNQKIPFAFLINNEIISQKYPIAIALKLCFEEILAKGKTGRALFCRDGRLSAGNADRRLVNKSILNSQNRRLSISGLRIAFAIVIGIDLGFSRSSVAYFRPEIGLQSSQTRPTNLGTRPL
jgi:hypothetical protein